MSIKHELTAYCEQFLQVLKAGFGQDKQVCATIFQEQSETPLPIFLVAIYLNKSDSEAVEINLIDTPDLMNRLQNLKELYPKWKGVEIEDAFYQDESYFYDLVELNGARIPTVFLAKPDKSCYWTPSVASKDANQVAADIFEAGS